MVFITAINEPLWALICAATFVVGRIMYAIGYRMKGPQGRIYGAIVVDIALFGAFIGSIVSLVNWDLESKDPRILPFSIDQFNAMNKA